MIVIVHAVPSGGFVALCGLAGSAWGRIVPMAGSCDLVNCAGCLAVIRQRCDARIVLGGTA